MKKIKGGFFMSCEIQVGFGRKDIMPIGSIELGGMGNGQ